MSVVRLFQGGILRGAALLLGGAVFAAPVRFDVTVNPNPLKVSEFADVTIKAVDANGEVDSTFTDADIWIEIEGLDYTDPDIVLPGGGISQLAPEDLGVKILSKGLTIKRAGTYTLMVADVYDTTLQGSVEIEVLADAGNAAIGDIDVVSPVSGGVEKSPTVEVVGSTTYPNTPLEIFIDGEPFEESISNVEGDFIVYLAGLEPGEHVLKINALDLEDVVVATSGDIPFTYEPDGGELFLGLEVTPGTTVMTNDVLTFTIKTASHVNSTFLKLGEGDMLPTEKVQPGVFTKQIAIANTGVYPVDVKLSVDGNSSLYEDLETITVNEPEPIDDNKRIITLNYTTDDARKKADLVWTYEGTIDYFKIKYGTDKNTLRLSLTTASPNGMLVLADPTIPYYAQVYPVDANGVVNGEPSSVITIAPKLPPAPVCGNAVLEGNEQCDDGNLASGDGCSFACTVEVVVPPVPVPLCGNNIREGTEQCDDGNVLNGDGCTYACMVEVIPPAPVEPTCNPQGIQLKSEKIGEQYYLKWAPVLNAKEYIVYRSDQRVGTTQQMSVVGKTAETMFEYPFDPYAESDKWAWYAVEAVCVDNAIKQVGDMTSVKVGPEKTIMVILLLAIISFMGWRLVRT